jgi:hypothetical protein
MIELANDEPRRHAWGLAGRERFTDQFRHETMTARLRQLYQQLLT